MPRFCFSRRINGIPDDHHPPTVVQIGLVRTLSASGLSARPTGRMIAAAGLLVLGCTGAASGDPDDGADGGSAGSSNPPDGSGASMGTGGAIPGVGGGPSDEPGLGATGETCTLEGALACAGFAQSERLRCANGRWASIGNCPGGSHCDTSDEHRGTCRPIIPECIGRAPDEVVCREDHRVACGVDQVSIDLLENCYACQAGVCYCPAGTVASQDDDLCTPCEDGTFSAENDASCAPWSNCSEGHYVSLAGTSSSDRQCAPCEFGTFSLEGNAESCSNWSSCSPGTHISELGTSTSDRECFECEDGTFTVGSDLEECVEWSICSPGTRVSNAGSRTSDRQCAVCPAGTVTLAPNTSSCLPSQVTVGFGHTCALLADGAVRCWGGWVHGYGHTNNIGDNETPASAGNVNVGGLVSQISASLGHTCAVLVNGSVRCWGTGDYGRLGYGNTEFIGDNEFPADAGDVNVGAPVSQVAAGFWHTCATLTNGKVRCWGRGADGQLGYGNTDHIGDDEAPAAAGDVNVGGLVSQVAAGYSHTCAVLTDGNVRCWGSGFDGALGYSTTIIGDNESPASAGNVNVGGSVTQVVVGQHHTCALLTTGSVRCWGRGTEGQLGYGNTNHIGINRSPASAGDVNVGGIVTQIAAGSAHTCALLADGNVRCWGLGTFGRLGYGNQNNVGDDETPASAGNVNVGGTVTQIDAGDAHTCALLTNGSIRCWGYETNGRLGYGTGVWIGDNEDPASAGDVPYL